MVTDLDLINAVIPYAANGSHCAIRLWDASLAISESGLDSMDVAVIGAYLSELFDVPLELQKEMPGETVDIMFAFLRLHGRRQIRDVQQIEEMLSA
jgi:acyl carrier protein